jgi:LysM repeat protein
MILFIVVILVAGTGLTVAPAKAASCSYYHVVRPGESLSWIARYYGAYWPYLAQINNIPAPSYRIYPGQTLCIAYGGYNQGNYNWNYGYQYPYYQQPYYGYNNYVTNWSFSIKSVDYNTSVTIRTYNTPSNVLFNAKMGRRTGDGTKWIDLPDVDTDHGGSFEVVFNIPDEFKGANQLVIRLIQAKKNGKTFHYDQWFSNTNNAGYWYGGYGVNYNPVYYNPGYWYPPPKINP